MSAKIIISYNTGKAILSSLWKEPFKKSSRLYPVNKNPSTLSKIKSTPKKATINL